MKKVLFILIAVFFCSINVNGQSVATIGMAVTQCNDFEFAKKMVSNDGLVYNSEKSTPNCAYYSKQNAKYASDVLIVVIYKMKGSSKVEKCVVTFGDGAYFRNLPMDLTKLGYRNENAAQLGLSIEPFQELWSCNELAMGLNLTKKGWFIATFFSYSQDVKFEHLTNQ